MALLNLGTLVRIAMFIDGGFFDEVSRYYKFGHERATRLSLEGIHGFARRAVSEREDEPFDHCRIVESNYFRGRFSANDAEAAGKLKDQASFDDILIRSGIRQHYLPVGTTASGAPKERGIEVALSLEAYSAAAQGRFDVMVLVGCDGDYLHLMRKLGGLGVRTVVMAWDFSYEYSDRQGRPRQKETRTSQALIDSAVFPLRMREIIEEPPEAFAPHIDDLFV